MTPQSPRECKHMLPNDECFIARSIVGDANCNTDCCLLHKQPYDFDCPDFTTKTDTHADKT